MNPKMEGLTDQQAMDLALHRGSRWVAASLDAKDMSPLGVAVADLLETWAFGIYHLDRGELLRVEWSNPSHLEMRHYGSMATFDDDKLTRLVLLAHERCVRVQIEPRSNRYLTIRFHARVRAVGRVLQMWERHPDVAEMVQRFKRRVYDGG